MIIIKEGVKQGCILSPYLFNFFINELFEKCESSGLGIKIGKLSIPIIGYCDDLIVLGSNVARINKLLQECGQYADAWKLKFNEKKCNWMVTGTERVQSPSFSLNGHCIEKVSNLVHLGIPVGEYKHVKQFFEGKFNQVD